MKIYSDMFPRTVRTLWQVIWEINGSAAQDNIEIPAKLMDDIPMVEYELMGTTDRGIELLASYIFDFTDLKPIRDTIYGKLAIESNVVHLASPERKKLAEHLPRTVVMMAKYYDWYTGDEEE